MKLKIHYIVIQLIILSSCSTSKDKFNALNDYIKLEIKDTTKSIIVVKEKVSSNMTIEIFNTNQIIALDSKKNGNSRHISLSREGMEAHEKKI